MVTENMMGLVQNVLFPYVIKIRSEINDENHPVVLIFDNLHQHLTDELILEFDKIWPVILIPLPPHSSHITQSCDACVFGLTKNRYTQLSNDSTKIKCTAKLCRIKTAVEQTLTKELVPSSWKHCGFLITIEDEICTIIDFSKEFQEKLRSMSIDEN